MLLKLILVLIVFVGIFKLLGGKLPSLKSREEKKLEGDTLVECQECSTFVTAKEAIIVSGKYYCSLECANS